MKLLNVDPLNPYGRPPAVQVWAMGFDGVRMVYRNHPDCYNYYRDCTNQQLKVLLVIARESLGPHTWQEFGLNEITNAYRVWAYQIGNEPDAQYNPANSKKANSVASRQAGAPSSWVMDPDDYRNFHATFAKHFRTHDPEAMIVTAGLCSGIPSWLFDLAGGAMLDANRIGVHPYTKNAHDAEKLLLEYTVGGGYPLVSEWNRPANEIEGYLEMLDRHDGWDGAWFCYSDGMVDGYGLVTRDGTLTDAGTAMLTALGTHPAPPPVDNKPPIGSASFTMGFRKFAEAGYADYIGHPLFDQYSPAPGLVVQNTTRGLLIWRQNYHPSITFIDHDHNTYINWDEPQ